MIMTQNGIAIRVLVAGISRIGRNTQGVKLINIEDGDRVIGMARVAQADVGDLDIASEPTNGIAEEEAPKET